MKHKNFKKIKKSDTQTGNKGFVILFAVMISSIILAITVGVLNITLREIKFSTSVKDTNDAFFAADTGAECALFYDGSTASTNRFTGGASFIGTMSCAQNTITPNQSPVSLWSFVVSKLGSNGQGCAKVTVDKRGTGLLCSSTLPTCIISKGYNDGGGSIGTCNPTTNNSVERQLELTY